MLMKIRAVVKKTVEVPQVQFTDKIEDEFTDKVIDDPIVLPNKVPIIQGGQKTFELLQMLFIVKMIDAPVSEETMEMIQVVPRERNLKRSTEEIKDVTVSSVMAETDEVVELIPQMSRSVLAERIQERNLKESVDTSIPQLMEEVFEVVKRFPQEQCQSRTVEQIADMRSPQQFISTASDVCLSAQRRFRWTEWVKRSHT